MLHPADHQLDIQDVPFRLGVFTQLTDSSNQFLAVSFNSCDFFNIFLLLQRDCLLEHFGGPTQVISEFFTLLLRVVDGWQVKVMIREYFAGQFSDNSDGRLNHILNWGALVYFHNVGSKYEVFDIRACLVSHSYLIN